MPEFRLVAEPVTDEARELKPFQWAPEGVGRRNKIGGTPDLLQTESRWPTCPACNAKMSFYGQLDSVNDEFVIADCGLIHVYLCWDCFQAAAVVDSH